MENKITLSESQKKRLEKLWFIYGNGGKYHTMGNHKLIQGFYQYNEDRREIYTNPENHVRIKAIGKKYWDEWRVTDDCLNAVNEILANP